MEIRLLPGEKLIVSREDADGVILIEWINKQIATGPSWFIVRADLPDDEGRGGEIYRETLQ